ncbi:MAG: pirin family protein [Leadbetterella sp.]
MHRSKFLGLSMVSIGLVFSKLFGSRNEDEFYIENRRTEEFNNNEMVQKISADKRVAHGQGAFQIRILYPGSAIKSNDSGIGTIGRFDHAQLTPGVFVGMHPHQNDEILSYLRSGNLVHKDSEGKQVTVSATKLMMMNAGTRIYHEESIPNDWKSVEMLQIFLRPEANGLEPKVDFHDFDEVFSENQWRLIAGNTVDSPLKIRSNTAVLDIRLTQNTTIDLPAFDATKTYLLYNFNGNIQVNDIALRKGDSLLIKKENIEVVADEVSDLVLFVTDENSTFSQTGMFSGNKM